MIQIDTIEDLQRFLRSMLARNFHHGHKIKKVTPILITYLLANVKLKHPVQVKEYNGEPKNTGWVYGKKNKRYYIAYNHETGNIEVRDDNNQGMVLVELNDSDKSYKRVRRKLKKYI